jgi:thiamine biosynthesis lipoprotein
VSRIAAAPGTFEFPDDSVALFGLYESLYSASSGAVSPLVGRALESLGYDRAYSLRPSGPTAPVPAWEDAFSFAAPTATASGITAPTLTTVRPVVIDVGAAGKGYLVDLVGEVLLDAGIEAFTIDASGDILHRGASPLRVGLEHPRDATRAIGVVEVTDGSLCASASNRRAWGDGLHHIIDATTGIPTTRVIATWAVAATGLLADGLATALFLTEPAALADHFDFDYVRMFSDGRVDRSDHLDGELFV